MPPRSAFTLVELLVSVVLLVLLVVFLGSALNHASQLWSMGESRAERMENLRAITESIGNDMRGALVPLDRSNLNGLQFVVNPSTLTGQSYNGDTVFWQAPIVSSGTAGDVAEIGYFVKWDMTKPLNPKPILCRFFVAPDGSFPGSPASNSNYRIYNPQFTIPSGTSPEPWLLKAGWLTDSLVAAVAPGTNATTLPAQSYQGLFAENVIGLWIRCQDNFGQPIVSDFQGSTLQVTGGGAYQYGYDSRFGYRYTDPNSGAILQTPGYLNASLPASQRLQPLAAIPPEVNVGVVIVDSPGAARINPSIMSEINTVIASSSNAASFIVNSGNDKMLKPIYSHLYSYQMEVYLENCR